MSRLSKVSVRGLACGGEEIKRASDAFFGEAELIGRWQATTVRR